MPVCGMKRSSEAAWERAMKIQEVMLRAMAKRITWWQAAEIIGISCRQMRRWQRRYEEHGYEGLRDRRRGRVSEKRVPLEPPADSQRGCQCSSLCFITPDSDYDVHRSRVAHER